MSFFCSANIGILGNSIGLLTRAIYDTTQEATIGDLSITPAYESRKDAQKDYCAAISVCSFPNKHIFQMQQGCLQGLRCSMLVHKRV